MTKIPKLQLVKHAIAFYAYLLVVWGFYRLLLQAPAPIEELIIKPVVWLLPLFYLLKREKANPKSIGITFHNFLPTVYFVIGLGVIFTFLALFINYLKYGELLFAAVVPTEELFWIAIILSFITAFSEEIAFRGYLLTRTLSVVKKEWKANLLVSVGWAMIHLPIAIFDWRLQPIPLLVYAGVAFVFSLGATFVFLRTRNIIAPILLHVLWQWPIILFR